MVNVIAVFKEMTFHDESDSILNRCRCKSRLVINNYRLTVPVYLSKNGLLVIGVDAVRCFPGLIGSIQQTTVARVTQQKLRDTLAPSSQGDVEGRVTFLQQGQNHD